MALTLVATAGSASANTYCTRADATTYHEGRLYSDDWNDADTTDQDAALVMATRLLDQWFDWQGSAVDSTQALKWPRTGVLGPTGYQLASNAIPAEIRDATAELARCLIAEDRTKDSDIETQGISSLKAGSVELSFTARAAAKVIPDSVLGFISARLGVKRGRSGGAVTLQRA